MAIDLSKATVGDIMAIHNEVLRNIALESKAKIGKSEDSAGHDSHGSNHSNNKIVEVEDIARNVGNILKQNR